MDQTPPQPLDDPALKAALNRALPRDTAPAHLRQRIETLATGGADKPIPLFKRAGVRRMLAAAVIILGFGSLAYQIWDANRPPDYNAATAFSQSLFQMMVDAHNARAASAAADKASTLSQAGALRADIGRPVFTPDLAKDGWTFQGAGVRNLSSGATAQLFFKKGAATLSVFSLSKSAAPDAADGQTYTASFKGAVIAGFTKGPGVYCIVGAAPDNSLTVDQVKSMLDQHRSELTGG